MRISRAAAFTMSVCGILATATGAAPQEPPVLRPTAPIALFYGRDLSGFDTWLVDHHDQDPDHVFTVVDQIDGAAAIRISGQRWGGIATRARYGAVPWVSAMSFDQPWWLSTGSTLNPMIFTLRRSNSGLTAPCSPARWCTRA
jgi:hypothetical protein